MTISQAEKEALKYSSRERDFIATAGLHSSVEAIQLKSGKWRAYISNFITPHSPSGQEAESKEVVRDNYGYIITGANRGSLISKIREEYAGWKWN